MIGIQKLSFCYPKNPVLEGIDLTLTPGHIYGLLGRNGAGKSSLLYHMCGLLFPSEGVVRMLNQNPADRSPFLLQKIFLLPEEVSFQPLSIDSYVKINAPFYPLFDYASFDHYIREFEVPDQLITKMSHGQQKKVLISFALASGAQILLMDEPTNGLDIPSKRQFRKIIAGSLRDDQIIVISTHQVKDLDSLIDHILVLDDRRIILDKSTDAVTERLTFKQIPELNADVIYSEGSLKGYAAVSINREGESTKLDMEIFFNALIAEKSRLLPLFNQ
jgi:ABC-2 type transport system ATP-binding protein